MTRPIVNPIANPSINSMTESHRCGYVAIIGRPNVGKSTLLNAFLAHKLSIISKKPQTTRHKILGIKTMGKNQLIFVDTPGLHKKPKHKINKLMIRTALSAIRDVDVILFMLSKQHWTEDEDAILHRLKRYKVPIIVLINKIDRIKDKDALLPVINNIQQKFSEVNLLPRATMPISAKNHDGVEALEKLLLQLIPESPHYFPADQITDRSERFWVAEIIREKLMRLLGEEIPHTLTVELEKFKQENEVLHVSALIWVERKGQKAIVIGKQGEGLKLVGSLARKEMEKEFNQKVFLQLWVKVKSGWTDDLRALTQLGYNE